jgi:hypothetical protein
VGSLGKNDAETGFRSLAEQIGDSAIRYPDGEPVDRANWIRFQIGMLEAHPDIKLVRHKEMQAEGEQFNRPYYRSIDGVVPSERLCRLSNAVPEPVELGFHLCYGDPGHKHVIEPSDLSVYVRFSNGFASAIKRSIQWVHMPVPRIRNDEPYFSPLKEINLASETELILGLVHHTGGIEATLGCMKTAMKLVEDVGVATECGLERRNPETLTELLSIHIAAANV